MEDKGEVVWEGPRAMGVGGKCMGGSCIGLGEELGTGWMLNFAASPDMKEAGSGLVFEPGFFRWPQTRRATAVLAAGKGRGARLDSGFGMWL